MCNVNNLQRLTTPFCDVEHNQLRFIVLKLRAKKNSLEIQTKSYIFMISF